MPPSSGRLTRRALIASAAAAAVPAGPEATRRPAPAAGLFTNPLDVKLADPCMIRDGGTYYLYATASMPEDANEGMPVWSSRDMVRWRCHGWAFRKRAEGWGTHWFWGPDVQRVAGGFLMHYGAFRKVDGKDVGRICVARSASAVGPFTDVKAPMFDWPGRGDAIDAFVFAEPDGAVYLYFTDAFQGRNTIWGARLSPDRLSLESEPKLLLQPDQPWEVDPVNEGAHVWKHGRGYCMMFSINDFRNPAYGMGFATADSPLGPWRKRAEGPVVRQAPGLRGPGCAGLIRSPDGKQTWAYMHVHLHPEGYARQLALARADLGPVAEGGRAFRVEPLSVAPQAAPSGAPPPARPRSDALGDRDIERRLWTIVDESPANWRKDGDAVVITAMDGDMWRARCDYRNLFLQPPWAADFRAAIHVAAEPTGNYEQAFLIAWQDADHYVRIGMLHADGPKFSAAIELDGVYEEVMVPNDLGGAVDLCLSRKGDIWTFEAASPSVRKRIGSPREARLSLPRVGFGAIAPGTKRPYEARFRSFRWADSSGN
jgi:GH43 family beta-xylosidase/regulation of enolase protein 1 (concanavalin A-like superfamily)